MPDGSQRDRIMRILTSSGVGLITLPTGTVVVANRLWFETVADLIVEALEPTVHNGTT